MNDVLKKIQRKLLTVCTVAVIMFAVVRGCHGPTNTDVLGETLRNVPANRVNSLLRRLPEAVDIHSATVPNRTGERLYVPPEAEVELIPKIIGDTLENHFVVKIKDKGFCFKPGIQGTLPLGVGLDVKLAYWGKYGLGVAGIYETIRDTAYGALYLSRHFEVVDNLEPVVGIRHDKSPYVGMRLSF